MGESEKNPRALREAIKVPTAFPDDVVVKMWRAFRSKYTAFSSREKFADYFFETIVEGEHRYSFVTSTGQAIERLRHPLSPQTLYNFYKSGLSDRTQINLVDGERKISASSMTLQVIFVFLVSISKDDVIAWLEQKKSLSSPPIEGLDTTFQLNESEQMLPHPVALFKVPETPSRTIMAHSDNFAEVKCPTLEGPLELHSILAFVEELAVVIPESIWRAFLQKSGLRLSEHVPQVESFDAMRHDVASHTIGFVSRDYQKPKGPSRRERKYHKGKIDQDVRYLLCGMRSLLNENDEFHISVRLEMELDSDFPNDFGEYPFDYMLYHFVKFHDPRFNDDYEPLLLSDLSEIEKEALSRILNFSQGVVT